MPEKNRDIEKYSKDYISSDFVNEMTKYRKKKILEILNTYNPKNILEIGCGIDSIANYYKNFSKFTIIEPSKDFIKQALKDNNPNIALICDFFENKINEFKKQNFDFIILSSLLHEVKQPEKILNGIKEISKKETIIHINVPNLKSIHLLWAYKSGLLKNLGDLTPRALMLQQNKTFDIEKLITFVETNGFQIVDKGSYFIKFFNHAKMQKCIDLGIIDSRLLDGLYELIEYMPDLGSEIFVNCRLK